MGWGWGWGWVGAVVGAVVGVGFRVTLGVNEARAAVHHAVVVDNQALSRLQQRA